MLAAVAAAVVWTASSICSSRGAVHLGGTSANLLRLGIGLPLLAALVAAAAALGRGPAGLDPAAVGWFLLSGAVGMGLSDIAGMESYRRAGVRIASLVNYGTGIVVACLAEWAWRGQTLGGRELAAMAAIFAGAILAVRPGRTPAATAAGSGFHAPDLVGGLVAGMVGGALFGIAAAISRHGYAVAAEAGLPIDGLTAAALRVAAGLAMTVALWLAVRPGAWRDGPGRWRQAAPWLGANAVLSLCGGLVLYQHALTTTPAGIVQAIVSLSPVLILGVGWATGADRPGADRIAGTALAILGVAALATLRG